MAPSRAQSDNRRGDDSRTELLSIVLPAHNEEDVLPQTYARFAAMGPTLAECGNNRGYERTSSAKYFLLLNSDTIVHPGTLAYCHAVMEREPDIGAMSCLLRNADGSFQNVTRKFPSPLRMLVCATGLPWKVPDQFGWADIEDLGWDRLKDKRDVDWIGGAFMFVRGDLVRRIGLLDEDFFFYGEDIEFSHRIRRAGYRVHYDPAVSITHLGGGSSDTSRMDARARSVHFWQGRYLVQRKCYGTPACILLRLTDILSYTAKCLRLRFTGRVGGQDYARLRDIRAMLLRPLRVSPPKSPAAGST